MKKREIRAVHEQDLDTFLQSLGLLQVLEEGKLKCQICGIQISKENLGKIYPSKGDIVVCCISPECYQQA